MIKINYNEDEGEYLLDHKKAKTKHKSYFINKIDRIRVEQWIVKLAQFWFDDRLRK